MKSKERRRILKVKNLKNPETCYAYESTRVQVHEKSLQSVTYRGKINKTLDDKSVINYLLIVEPQPTNQQPWPLMILNI